MVDGIGRFIGRKISRNQAKTVKGKSLPQSRLGEPECREVTELDGGSLQFHRQHFGLVGKEETDYAP